MTSADAQGRRRRALLDRYRVTDGADFDLDAFSSDDLPDGSPDKEEAKALLQAGIARMAALQELLYANATWSVLIVLQAMDAGGKDSTIRSVMSGVNPQGVVVTSFKEPDHRELAHDFLWRVHRAAPSRGMIGIFNRSHYEEVLVARVHKEILDGAKLPADLVAADGFWSHRIADIAAFESYLARQGTLIIKFFLDVGRDEQRKRFLSRLEEPAKMWKFSASDVRERDYWAQYRSAYGAAIAGTASPRAPWYVVPADRKWFARLIVSEAISAALEDLNLEPPQVSERDRAKLAATRSQLQHE